MLGALLDDVWIAQLTLASAPLVYEKLLPNVRTLRLKLNVVWVGHAKGEKCAQLNATELFKCVLSDLDRVFAEQKSLQSPFGLTCPTKVLFWQRINCHYNNAFVWSLRDVTMEWWMTEWKSGMKSKQRNSWIAFSIENVLNINALTWFLTEK